MKHELTTTLNRDIILRGNRYVLPQALQRRAIKIVHEGHQGIEKSKRLIRTYLWFPFIDKQMKNEIGHCMVCQATNPATIVEPLKMTPLPDNPWSELSADFHGPLPTGEYLLVLIDDYSRYPVVEVLHSTAASAVIPAFDRVMAMLGIPNITKTDNEPPFNSHQFPDFAKYMGFEHRKITLRWPQANGEAERFMRTLGKVLQTARIEGKPWKQQLYQFLRNYHATPHCPTQETPGALLFGRHLKVKLPRTEQLKVTQDDKMTHTRDENAKEK